MRRALALGMGCKEVMAMAPILVYLLDALMISGSFAGPFRQRGRFYAALALTMLIVPILIWTQADFTSKTGEGFVLTTPWTYALTQSGMILHYLRLCAWPDRLAIDYYDWPLAKSVRDVLPQALTIVGLLALTTWGVVRRRPLAFLGAWVFIILAPTSSFIPLRTEVGAERRMYLPLIALVLGVVLGAVWVANAVKSRWVRDGLALALVALVPALALATRWRNVDYSSKLLIWSDAVAKRPNNAGVGVLADELRVEGRWHDSRLAYEQAIRFKPWDARYQGMLGNLMVGEGNVTGALPHLFQAVEIDPKSAEFHTNLGYGLAQRGHRGGDAPISKCAEPGSKTGGCAGVHRRYSGRAGRHGRGIAAFADCLAAQAGRCGDPAEIREVGSEEINRSGCGIVHGFGLQLAFIALGELFDFLFGVAEDSATVPDEELSAFVLGNAVFEGDFTAFNGGEDGLEFGEGVFEVFGRGLRLLRHRNDAVYGKPRAAASGL